MNKDIAIIYENILEFHKALEDSDDYPIYSGIREAGLIKSAVNAPFATIFGEDAFPTLFDKAARLGFGLAKNHGFEDGNKRTALHAMITLLGINGIEINYNQDEIQDLICDVAESKISVEDLSAWLKQRAIY